MTFSVSSHCRQKRVGIILALLLGVLCFAASSAWAQADEWRGWRGSVQEGRASPAANPPLHWSATQNVVWKTVLPGAGHSSPIVTADSVYVTAAWAAPSDVRLRLAVQWLLWLLLLFAAVPALVTLLHACKPQASASPRLIDLFRLAAVGVAILLLCALVFVGESVLDFHRAAERSWIAACLVGVLSLRLSVLASSGSRSAFAGGMALLLFSVLLGMTIPDQQHTIAADPRSDVSILIYLVIALPVLAGIALLMRGVRQILVRNAKDTAPKSARLHFLVLVLRAVPLLLSLTALFILIKLVRAQQDGTDVTISVGAAALPHLPVWVLLFPAGMLGVLMLWRRRRGASFGNNAGIVLLSLVPMVLSLYAVLEQALLRVPYLSYLLGSPTITPMLGKNAVLLFGACCFALLGWEWRRQTTANLPAFVLPFRAAAFLLPAVYFAYALFVPKEPRLERGIVSVNRRTGTIQWQCGGVFALGEVMHSDNSPATPTPVTDGERIYAWFGTPGLMGADKQGRRLWLNTELPYKTREGVASSPIVFGDKVIILSESDAGSFLAAVDSKTGVTRWKTERHKKKHSFAGNCRTPNLVRIGGREVILVWGYEDISGYDPETGRELWTQTVEDVGTGGNPVASAVTDGSRLYLAGPYQTLCFDLNKLGSKANALLWKQKADDGAQCSSPVVANNLVFAVSDNGSAYCLDALTGKELWRHDLEQQHYASVVAAGDRVYFCGTQGLTTVVACDRTYRLLAQNNLDEPTFASFAPIDDALFIRTRTHLYCLREGH